MATECENEFIAIIENKENSIAIIDESSENIAELEYQNHIAVLDC